ncbi:MAG: Smr/MutS family protein [bacterium]|nr:Smr/MutS family protein [bacterium]
MTAPPFEIDLHGANVEQALRRLGQEVYTCRARGVRQVLVITGRGWGSESGKSALREAVEGWLKQAEAVVQWTTARKGGAFLVDLKRTD